MSREGKPCVLVVEDNRDMLEIIARGLAHLGYAVKTAADGLTGLASAIQFRPAIVMIDIALPKMNGWELARRIRRLPFEKQPRLIAFSGLTDPAHRARSLAAGFETHLGKPLKLDQLDELLAAATGSP